MMINANDTNIALSHYSKDILEKLYHKTLPYGSTLNFCRNGIFYRILQDAD